MSRTVTDARQVTLRQFLQQIANATSYAGTTDAKPANQTELDNLLAAINDELTPLLNLSATSSPSLVVNVGAAVLANSESSRNRSIPHIGALLPNSFSSGTITFPAASGGAIAVSPGNNGILTVASGNYIKVMIYMDATGALNVLPGVENAVEASATVLAAPKKTLPIGYITLQNVGGVIQPVAQNKIYQFGTGAGGGSGGSGSGTGDDLNALTFKASFTDQFDDIPSGSASAVDISANKTDSTTYSAANAYYRISYDASKTVTGTGTAMTLSAAPSFTVKIGDMLRVGTQARRITAVASQTSYTIESAFSSNPSAAAATVSQAVYSKDLNNIAIDGLALSSAFSTTISQIMVDYSDTVAADDVIFDPNVTPVIGFSASSDGSLYSDVQVRPTNLTDSQAIVNLPSAGTNLYLRFFSNKTSGSGFVNILDYKAFLHRDLQSLDGSLLNQSFAFTDGTGTPVNCSLSVVSGKTRAQTTFSFPMGVNAGTTNGALKVYIDGKKIPRYIDATLTPDASYKEIDQRTIELDGDYGSLNLSLEIIQDVAVVDNLDTNSSNIVSLQEIQQQGFQSFVNDNGRLTATASPGTPQGGMFYSTIFNRKAIPDLTANLKAQMGVERIPIQRIYELQDEFGPNGERVFGLVNDKLNQVRFIGDWSLGQSNNTSGIFPQSQGANTTDAFEITFYGTGLNLLVYYDTTPYDYRYTVDGGTESANIFGSHSAVLTTRNYSINGILPVVSNLSPGIHTVRIRAGATGIQLSPSGFEILNESSSIKVNPGSSYVNGKKLTLNSQQSIPYNSGFESGTLGTRGGRVLIYQKADGSIGKAVNPAGSQLNLASADHSNEEPARKYTNVEFGVGNSSQDFSTFFSGASINKSFTLDDGTTNLTLSGPNVANDFRGVGIDGGAGTSFLTFTFVGTGLDVLLSTPGVVGTNTVYIDGVSIGTLGTSISPAPQKIVSGLPYGTHTLKIVSSGGGGQYLFLRDFIVYQPKTPSLPTNAIQLGSYNVMANFVQNTTFANYTNSTGVLKKLCEREIVYLGAWNITTSDPSSYEGGFLAYNSVSGTKIKYTFFGTGIEMRGQTFSGNSTNISVTVDGVAPSNGQVYTNNWSYSGGVLNQAAGGTSGTTGAIMSITGLSLGLHTIVLTNNTSGQINISSFNLITPIHSVKSNLYLDFQNTLSIGSQGISDERVFTPVKESLPAKKALACAVPVVATPSSSINGMVPMPDMSCTVKTTGGDLVISGYSVIQSNASSGVSWFMGIFVDGVQVAIVQGNDYVLNGITQGTVQAVVPVAPGYHKVDLCWNSGGYTISAYGVYRSLIVQEK